ncbi:MAG TPA: DUF6282 family protein [Candidatus Binatia bacterium]|nr:DUF6282 family protein [Candidatus Binatia bacterium]
MPDTNHNYATPSAARSVTSYPARRGFKQAIDPSLDKVLGVEEAIDIHCHAHEGQQDALGVAKLASKSGMTGLLYKTIVGRKDPAAAVAAVRSALNSWCEEKHFIPVHVWAGSSVTQGFLSKIEPAWCAKMLKSGVIALWMPNNTSAHTLSIVGGKPSAWDKSADPNAHTEPLPWSESLKYGHYLLDENGRLMAEIEDIFRMAYDYDAAIFFGHPTKQEFRAMAEFSHKIGFKKGVVDHPFSPFVNLTIEEMKDAAGAGLWINFTYDELSPLLGIDPANMYAAIRTVGPEHCTLSSDAGEPLFPNSVESLRLLRNYMAAFGCTPKEIYTMCTVNPSFIVGLNLSATQRASAVG